MAFGRRNQMEIPKPPDVEKNVLSCEADGCNGWMREEFASEDELCPLCGGSMKMEIRTLPEIDKNNNFYGR